LPWVSSSSFLCFSSISTSISSLFSVSVHRRQVTSEFVVYTSQLSEIFSPEASVVEEGTVEEEQSVSAVNSGTETDGTTAISFPSDFPGYSYIPDLPFS
jgi:hypothetical protein